MRRPARQAISGALLPPGLAAQEVDLTAGELLHVDVSAADPVELVLRSPSQGLVARGTGHVLRESYLAVTTERVGMEIRPVEGRPRLGERPSVRLMVAIEPPGRAESSPEGDGAAFLAARQHLLLNLFGVNPRGLHPLTGLALARGLDALEVVARSAGAGGEALPVGLGNYTLVAEHGANRGMDQATYRLDSQDASLTLTTRHDRAARTLHCRLEFRDGRGVRIQGSLTHTLAQSDGIPLGPVADPVGDYLASGPSEPGQPGEIDDFSDVVAGGAAGRGEGVGSFVEGALGGDFADNDTWSAVGGQVALGFVPVAGQVADVRDIVAASVEVGQGREGSWARLGITILAVIPGLDFLKGGSKAGRKALAEASDEAVEGVTRGAARKLAKVLSREAAARAVSELKALAVARQEMLARLQGLLVDQGLDEGTRRVLQRARNAIQDHLQPSDLSGALRDRHGLPVRRKGSGRAYDHHGEVSAVTRSMARMKEELKEVLVRTQPGSDAYRKLSREIEAISEMTRRITGFLEIR